MEDIYTEGNSGGKVLVAGFFFVLVFFMPLITEIKFKNPLQTLDSNGLKQQLNELAYLWDTRYYLVEYKLTLAFIHTQNLERITLAYQMMQWFLYVMSSLNGYFF